MPKTITLISGGMDSLLITALSNEQGVDQHALFFKYGQKTEDREEKAFHDICEHYGIVNEKRKVLDLHELGKLGGSSLTDDSIAVESELGKAGIPQSYVPFRNSIFLAYAVSWAEVIGAEKIIIGAVLEDAPGYPDCRPEYYTSYNHMISYGAKSKIRIEVPIIRKTKKDIIQQCLDLKAPLGATWSCYQNTDKPCGVCDSCVLREKAFQSLDVKDPIK